MANEKFIALSAGLDDQVAASGNMFIVTGKKQDGSVASGTTGNQVGNYDSDGLGTYVASAFFTGANEGYRCMIIDKEGRPSSFTCWFASAPTPGKYTLTQDWKEDPDDDSECIQDSTTYFKYELA